MRQRLFGVIGVIALALLSNAVILTPTPLLLKAVATLVLTVLLPGSLLVTGLIARSVAPPAPGERIVLSVGAGYSCLVLTLLALSYLPGPLTRPQTLLAFNTLILTLTIVILRHPLHPFTPSPFHPVTQSPNLPITQSLSLLALLLLAAGLRLTNLGYAEFQGDEARLALRAAEVIQGYENALFVHKKGPTEILLPTAVYVLSDRLTETTARLPFTLANLTGVVAILVLGRRLFAGRQGVLTGGAAALLLAVDGYLVGFGRVVQYQSIVFLMDVLVVLIVVRLAQTTQAQGRYLTLAALLWATGLLSHYEAALVIFPVLYLFWVKWRAGETLVGLVRTALIPVVVGATTLAAFYVPFVRNPAFTDTYYYLTDYRMGGGNAPFNHLADFFARATVYSSTYYLLTLIALTAAGLAWLYWRHGRGPLRWPPIGALLIGLPLTFLHSTWGQIGGVELTWLFFLALLAGAWLLPGVTVAERALWLWFGAPLILALFFTAIPNTHVYSFFIPWALLAGLVIERGWAAMRVRLAPVPARLLGGALAGIAILVFGWYEYQLFVHNRVEVLRTWGENRPHGYWVTYDEPVEIAIFGFPLNNGWKAVAGLYAAGTLQGQYDTNARDVVAEWYTRGAHYCATQDPRYFMLANPVEPTLADETAALRANLLAEHKLFGTVSVQGRPALEIFERTADERVPQLFALEDFAPRFDTHFSTPEFERIGPVGSPAAHTATAYRFGDAIHLTGYRLEPTTVRRGESLTVTLYWSASGPIPQAYAVFVQIIDLGDLAKAGQRDGSPGCGRHPTPTWLPGDTIADRYTVPIDPAARPGSYTVLVGLYAGEQRLEVFGADGQSLGPHLALTQVEVGR
jgi:hypothetical protein